MRMIYVSLLALGLAATASAQWPKPAVEPPKGPPTIDQLLAELEAQGKKESDATKAKAEAKAAIEAHLKDLRAKLARYGIDACPPPVVVPPPKPPEVPPPAPKADPTQATGKLRFGTSGCTATAIWPRRLDGRWDILTASHCTGGVGSRGVFTLKDGRSVGVTVTVRETSSDISWMVTDEPVENMPFAILALHNPSANTPVWHMGYGVQNPGNRETGKVIGATNQGQLAMELSVSSGDSGSGIFREDNGELIAVVCCTTRRGAKVTMYGGSAEMANQLRPRSTVDTGNWEPIDIPVVVVRRP